MKKNKTNPLLPLSQRTPRRFFCFGCSFTNYFWPTWADILADALSVQYWNYGVSGAGNQFIANMISQADNIHGFNSDDLIMVCWTQTCREDRFVNGQWLNSRGNVYANEVYDSSFIEKYCDPTGFLLRDLATVKLCKGFLESKKCQYHFMQMSDLIDPGDGFQNIFHEDQHLRNEIQLKYRATIESILPSFFQVLWRYNMKKKIRNDKVNVCALYFDGHPTVIEHFNYLEKTFIHDFPRTIKTKVYNYHARFKMANIIYSRKIKQAFSPYQITDTDYWEIINDSPFIKSNSLGRL